MVFLSPSILNILEIVNPNESNDGLDELHGAIRMATMGIDGNCPATLASSDGLEAWLSELFEPIFGPHLIQVFDHATRGHSREICELDSGLKLESDQMMAASQSAGEELTILRAGALHSQAMDKVCIAIAEDEIPGHHSTLFAVYGAGNHLPLNGVLAGFVFDEWRRSRTSERDLEAFSEAIPSVNASISRVFRAQPNGGGGQFRIA